MKILFILFVLFGFSDCNQSVFEHKFIQVSCDNSVELREMYRYKGATFIREKSLCKQYIKYSAKVNNASKIFEDWETSYFDYDIFVKNEKCIISTGISLINPEKSKSMDTANRLSKLFIKALSVSEKPSLNFKIAESHINTSASYKSDCNM